MLPIVLVLLVAQCVFGAPSVNLNAYSINEIAPTADNGRLVSSFITDGTFELVDGGVANVYALTAQQVLNDLANQPDGYSQAIAVAQTLGVIGEIAHGYPGDGCVNADVVNAVVSGNAGAIRQAVGNYVGKVNANIDTIVNLVNNPGSLRESAGHRGNCPGAGRSYQFEAAWDNVLSGANPYQVGLLNEQYCAARRLYGAYNIVSNNIGSALSAAAVGPVTQIYSEALGPVATFLRTAVGGGNVAAAAANAKAAINRAASRM